MLLDEVIEGMVAMTALVFLVVLVLLAGCGSSTSASEPSPLAPDSPVTCGSQTCGAGQMCVTDHSPCSGIDSGTPGPAPTYSYRCVDAPTSCDGGAGFAACKCFATSPCVHECLSAQKGQVTCGCS